MLADLLARGCRQPYDATVRHLITSTLLTLVVVPSLYRFFESARPRES